MAGRLNWFVASEDLDGVMSGSAGQTVLMYRKADNTLIGTGGSGTGHFADDGGGAYHITHTISEAIYITVGGVIAPGSDGLIFPADDKATAADLASTAHGKGASLIGVEDASGRFTYTNVEAILAEFKTAAELAATTSGKGASLIGVQDAVGLWSGATVEAILANELWSRTLLASTAETEGAALIGTYVTDGIGTGNLQTDLQAIATFIGLFSGLSGSIGAVLQRLVGSGANVTKANLETLTAGSTSNGGSLHSHSLIALLGNILEANGADLNLNLRGGLSEGQRGDVILDVSGTTLGDGRALVRKRIGGVAQNVAIVTEDTLDGTGAVTGLDRYIIFADFTTGTPADDPLTKEHFTETTGSYVIHAQIPFVQLPSMSTVWLETQAKVSSGGNAYVKFAVDSEECVPVKVTATSYTAVKVSIDLSVMPVTVPTLRVVKLSLESDGTHTIYVNYTTQIYARP